MLRIDESITVASLRPALDRLWDLAGPKLLSINQTCTPQFGTPVFTVGGKYQPQGWTEWTQGFQFGCTLLQFDATGDEQFLTIGRDNTFQRMATHASHTGVHDHGFNNVSTYGNLRRLMLEGRIPHDPRELAFYELALKVSSAVQASRWSTTIDGDGYIYSFNGPHSLFCDTIRSLRSLSMGYHLGHELTGENDLRTSLLDRLLQHVRTTAKYNVYYGEGRDLYDVWGRVAHESIFNVNDGRYRCPSTQQGYSPFSTWTRGLAWIMVGAAEQLEFLETVDEDAFTPFGGKVGNVGVLLQAARASSDFYIQLSPTDGIPYWDTGAPGLAHMDRPLDHPADPFNAYEPVDSSAAAIGAQGLLRLGRYLQRHNDPAAGTHYFQAGLTVLQRLLDEPYLSLDANHQGLLLHSVYHRPRQWDHVPNGGTVPFGESTMWGDYHLLELAVTADRRDPSQPEYYFFGPK
ncbi:MAG: glycosyl hydrolase [Pirellulaceae bacterium]|nr:glycoside hydrolase family 88 protein [Planctomycetales bacterium]